MSKSKKKQTYNAGKETDHLNTQAGLGNVGEALDSAMKPIDITEMTRFDDLLQEIAQRFPEQYDNLKEDAINISETDSLTGAIKFLTNELNKLNDQASAEKPEANLHWSANPSSKFNNELNELIGMFIDTNQPELVIEQFRDSVLQQTTEEDAIKMIAVTKQQFNANIDKIKEALNNDNPNSNKEETKMNENNTNNNAQNVNAQTTPVIDAATLAAMQNAAIVKQPKAAESALTTTEKVVLYTAAGVAVTALIFGVIAIAKANRANARITDLEIGGNTL